MGSIVLSADNTPPALCCPSDRAPLQRAGDAMHCPVCARDYAIRDGVVDFLGKDDPFYEGAFNNEVRYVPRSRNFLHQMPLWLISNGYLWAVRKALNQGARVVELGCAGGVAWLGTQYQVIGVDVSQQGLALAAKKYSLCVRSDSLKPIPDGSVDAVISSYFWEHIAADDKEAILDEVARILKPGGQVIFIYDVATHNPLISWLRARNPQLYQASFLDADGHIGYQSVAQNEALFLKHGLRITKSHSLERTPLQSTSVYLKMKRWNGSAKWFGRVLSVLDRKPILLPYQAFLRLIDETVGRLFPSAWGRMAITVAQKP
ncbi:MAG TPA: methyltransferase domain-containing protein [Rhizomicrobium sp.]|jgi:SAM-dependent methyltransferase|nr:methyltransferase domain-containing protein [Rhizomicrobium sp.]